jgi:hypothetical protein
VGAAAGCRVHGRRQRQRGKLACMCTGGKGGSKAHCGQTKAHREPPGWCPGGAMEHRAKETTVTAMRSNTASADTISFSERSAQLVLGVMWKPCTPCFPPLVCASHAAQELGASAHRPGRLVPRAWTRPPSWRRAQRTRHAGRPARPQTPTCARPEQARRQAMHAWKPGRELPSCKRVVGWVVMHGCTPTNVQAPHCPPAVYHATGG